MIEFTNREIATFIWLILFISWVLTDRKVRCSFFRCFQILTHYKVLTVYGVMIGYVYGEVRLFAKIWLWKLELIKETVYWFFGTAAVMLIQSNADSRKDDFFKTTIKQTFATSIIIEFITNFYCFSLWGELILIPVLAIISMVGTYSSVKKEYEVVKKFTNRILGMAGIWFLSYFIHELSIKPDEFLKIDTLRDFVYTPLMTLGFLPFIFSWTLFSEYEGFFTRVGFFHKRNPVLARKLKLLGMQYAKLNPWKLRRLWRGNFNKFMNATDKTNLAELLVIDENSLEEGL